ncbi:MAG TPA: glycosyltransferase, partial [Burkholderiaceae bacterium]|nr:glycosyltransferase [Burkholderiaceae bacterium]
HASQWEVGSERRLDWHRRDVRRMPLAALMAEVWRRYERPMLLAETSHVGMGRASWLHDVAHQVRAARAAGLPVLGICLYPLTDRPDWQQPSQWHRSGLWHVATAHASTTLERSVQQGDSTAGLTSPPGARRKSPRIRAEPPPLARLADGDYLQALRQWQQVLPSPASADPARRSVPLLAFSHLRWGFVRHRSHQLLSRLARHWPLVVVEEPKDSGDAVPWIDRVVLGPQLDILVPHLPGGGCGFNEALNPALQKLLQTWWHGQRLGRPIVWITTPMALPLAASLRSRSVVYDCADELGGFLNPPAGLAELERAALRQADLVLAAGRPLAQPRAAAAGSRLKLVPNGADRRLFAPRGPVRGSWEWAEATLLRPGVQGPQLGYAGVIDERIDVDMVAALAKARPQWQFVFVGPIVKIDSLRLPRGPNIHWLGEQPYRVLPGLMASWKVALLPFVDSLATCRASPIKLLEALAMGLPVVATRLPGIVDLCLHADTGSRVRLAGPGSQLQDWLEACADALCDQRQPGPLPEHLDWDRIAEAAHRLLQTASDSGATRASAAPLRRRVDIALRPLLLPVKAAASRPDAAA